MGTRMIQISTAFAAFIIPQYSLIPSSSFPISHSRLWCGVDFFLLIKTRAVLLTSAPSLLPSHRLVSTFLPISTPDLL
ncbi:hypothetical protein MN608_09588 [Microdochium nivale]|nr:hypothetical protein MN608_09588 [Microdochium nivale]